MTDAELQAIRERCEAVFPPVNPWPPPGRESVPLAEYGRLAADVPALLAEVARLRGIEAAAQRVIEMGEYDLCRSAMLAMTALRRALEG